MHSKIRQAAGCIGINAIMRGVELVCCAGGAGMLRPWGPGGTGGHGGGEDADQHARRGNPRD